MPHLTLEASANIHESNTRIQHTLIECQNLLVLRLPTQLSSCKSRAILHDIYVVSDSKPDNAFIHLTVKLFKGRSSELLMKIAEELKEIISKNFIRSSESLNLDISIEIVELSEIYVKS